MPKQHTKHNKVNKKRMRESENENENKKRKQKQKNRKQSQGSDKFVIQNVGNEIIYIMIMIWWHNKQNHKIKTA